MAVIERHVSADGILRFIVDCGEDGDLALGFEGGSWHTHGDILSKLLGVPPEKAVRQYIDDLLSCRAVIAVTRMNQEICDLFVVEDPQKSIEGDRKYAPPGETTEYRYWDGSPWRLP